MKGGVRLYTQITITSQKNWPWWRAVWDFTLHNNTSQKNWPWWRAVCDFTLHNKYITKEMTCMNVAWGLCWGGSRSTKPCVFPCQVAAADDERYLLCAAVAAVVGLPFFLPHCKGGFKLLWVCFRVRSYRVLWNLWLQIALEWLHDCCHLALPCA